MQLAAEKRRERGDVIEGVISTVAGEANGDENQPAGGARGCRSLHYACFECAFGHCCASRASLERVIREPSIRGQFCVPAHHLTEWRVVFKSNRPATFGVQRKVKQTMIAFSREETSASWQGAAPGTMQARRNSKAAEFPDGGDSALQRPD